MERALCTTSSDSHDSTTEMDEEGVPSNTGQRGSLYELVQSSTPDDTPGSIGFPFINKAVSSKKSWDSMGSVKAEPEEKPPHKVIQDLIHFRKKDGSKVPVFHGMRTAMAVNISEVDESEDLTRQTMSGDEEQELASDDDFGEPVEDLELYSCEFGVSQTKTPRKSELQKKNGNFTEDGQGQASKLAKSSEHPQKNQMPCATTESGESSTDITHWQWSERFQARHLEENNAVEDPVTCTQSTESFSPSSQLLDSQKEHTGKVTYNCFECNKKCKSSLFRSQHRILVHNLKTPFKCPECYKHFVTADRKHQHRRFIHNVWTPNECSDCNEMFRNTRLLRIHQSISHTVYDTKGFAIDEEFIFPWELRE